MSLLKSVSLLVVLLQGSACLAQGVGPDNAVRDVVRLQNANARHVVDLVSTGMVIGSLVLPCTVNRNWTCLKNEGLSVLTAAASAEITKRIVHRERPDKSDKKSFFSEHTAIACAATIDTKFWLLCPAVGFERMEVDKHYLSDVVPGFFVGFTSRIVWGGK